MCERQRSFLTESLFKLDELAEKIGERPKTIASLPANGWVLTARLRGNWCAKLSKIVNESDLSTIDSMDGIQGWLIALTIIWVGKVQIKLKVLPCSPLKM